MKGETALKAMWLQIQPHPRKQCLKLWKVANFSKQSRAKQLTLFVSHWCLLKALLLLLFNIIIIIIDILLKPLCSEADAILLT